MKKPKNSKVTLGVIITLSVIFIPLGTYSTYLHFEKKDASDSQKCDLRINSTTCYTCENKDGYCSYAYNYIEDDFYSINYYKGNSNYVKMSEKFAFVMDSSSKIELTDKNTYPKTRLFNIETNNSNITFKGVKDYGIGIKDNYYILIDDNGNYGLFVLDNSIKKIVDYKYKFIGLTNKIDNGVLDNKVFVVLENNTWHLIDKDGNNISVDFTNEIYDYVSNIVITKNNNYYNVYNFNGEAVLYDNYKQVKIEDQFIILNSLDGVLNIYDSNNNKIISKDYNVDDINDCRVEVKNKTMSVYIKNNLVESIAI